MTHRPTNHAASTGDTSADTNHAQGKEQSEKNTVNGGRWVCERMGQWLRMGRAKLAGPVWTGLAMTEREKRERMGQASDTNGKVSSGE
jgi:hypothetical protein